MNYLERAKAVKNTGSKDSVPALIVELLDAAAKFHILHLIVRGTASYAQHKALNELYDALPDLADGLAESWQGATLSIPNYPTVKAPDLGSVEEAISYIKALRDKIEKVQKSIDYSEIINDLDTIKTELNSTVYKLKFLK